MLHFGACGSCLQDHAMVQYAVSAWCQGGLPLGVVHSRRQQHHGCECHSCRLDCLKLLVGCAWPHVFGVHDSVDALLVGLRQLGTCSGIVGQLPKPGGVGGSSEDTLLPQRARPSRAGVQLRLRPVAAHVPILPRGSGGVQHQQPVPECQIYGVAWPTGLGAQRHAALPRLLRELCQGHQHQWLPLAGESSWTGDILFRDSFEKLAVHCQDRCKLCARLRRRAGVGKECCRGEGLV
mmetsp:Transcript_54859/g.123803  ORF Transcript_54859/g.123803 Transcript_54859/m.123803 type:complete len:236 (+) Transcript_54859:377-1084(+)